MPQTSQIIERLQLITGEPGAVEPRLNFQVQTIVGLMIAEGDRALDPIGRAALHLLAKNLNVSASWLVDGKPGKTSTKLTERLVALQKESGVASSDIAFLVKPEQWRGLLTYIERLPDSSQELKFI